MWGINIFFDFEFLISYLAFFALFLGSCGVGEEDAPKNTAKLQELQAKNKTKRNEINE